MNDFPRSMRRTTSVQTLLLLMAACAMNDVVIAADSLDESDAVRKIERLGGIVNERRPNRPVTIVEFKLESRFGDDDLRCSNPWST